MAGVGARERLAETTDRPGFFFAGDMASRIGDFRCRFSFHGLSGAAAEAIY